jgi:hypothetical protein
MFIYVADPQHSVPPLAIEMAQQWCDTPENGTYGPIQAFCEAWNLRELKLRHADER